MKTFTVGDFKTNFSEIIDWVKSGEEIAISYGRKKEIIAYMVPPGVRKGKKRKLGLYAGKAKVTFMEDFKMTEEDFLGL